MNVIVLGVRSSTAPRSTRTGRATTMPGTSQGLIPRATHNPLTSWPRPNETCHAIAYAGNKPRRTRR